MGTLSLLSNQLTMMRLFPNFWDWLFDKVLDKMSAKAFDIPKEWNLLPGPSVAVTSPLVADEIFAFMESGYAEPVGEIKEITGPRTVQLTDGRVISDVDAIVYCTGYDICCPFVAKEFNPYPTVGAPANLYRGIFPIHEDPAVQNSLAFMGHSAVAFPGFAQFEWVSLAISQIWQGNAKLPSYEESKAWHREWLDWKAKLLAKQKMVTTSYVVVQNMPDYIQWVNETAGTGVFEHFGWFKSKAWAFWWQDRELYKLCLSGVLSPAVWRLFETGKRKAWPGAREQIFKDNEIWKRGTKKRKEIIEQAKTVNKGK
jgi:dimethylaniline monooxygenase (N-oxide forming)